MSRIIHIGADGGGTRTVFAAADAATGRIVAEAEAGSINYNFVGTDEAVRQFFMGIGLLGIDRECVGGIAIGDPATDDVVPLKATEEFRRRIGEGFSPGIPVVIRSDVYMTLYGLTRGNRGVLVVSGTGSMGIAADADGRIFVSGGWGRLTEDEGSGYYIGINGIKAALRYADGMGEKTVLLEKMLSYYGVREARDMINVFYGGAVPDIAGFSAVVGEAAEEGDAEAGKVLRLAAGKLTDCAASLIRRIDGENAVVGVYGSVLCKNGTVRNEFEKRLGSLYPGVTVKEPDVRPEYAAIGYLRDFSDGKEKR